MLTVLFSSTWRRRNLVLGTVLLCSLVGATATALHSNLYTGTAFLKPAGNFEKFYAELTSLKRDQITESLYRKPSLFGQELTIAPLGAARVMAISYRSDSAYVAQVSANTVLENYINKLGKVYQFHEHDADGKKKSCSEYLLDTKTQNLFDECLKNDVTATDSANSNIVEFKRAALPQAPLYNYLKEFMISALAAGLLIGITAGMIADAAQRGRA